MGDLFSFVIHGFTVNPSGDLRLDYCTHYGDCKNNLLVIKEMFPYIILYQCWIILPGGK